MPSSIDRIKVQQLLAGQNATLIEVMPRDEFEAEHITGAINIPIKELNARTAAHLDKNRPVIVYCWDMQ